MAKTTVSNELQALKDGKLISVAQNSGKIAHYRATITLAAQANGDKVELFHLPKGSCLLGFLINSSVTLGTATIAIGDSTTADKYKQAAVFTTADVPAPAGKNAATLEPIGDDGLVVLTVGTAALPASGTLVVDALVAVNN